MMNFLQNNDLGGRAYTDAEQALLFQLANLLKSRAPAHRTGEIARPRDYMDLYVRAAGAVYETARALAAMNLQRRSIIHNYNIDDWLRILTGFGMLKEATNDTLGLDTGSDDGRLTGDCKPGLPDPKNRNDPQ
jgi:hypothetical protein